MLVIYQESFKRELILLFTTPVSHRPKQYWIFVSTVQSYNRQPAVGLTKIKKLLVTERPVMTEDSQYARN
jgi:hypothetical protein